MGNNSVVPPSVEKRNNAVDLQVGAEKGNDTVIGVSSSNAAAVDASTIYIRGIDDFLLFLKGEKAAGTLEERQKFQRSFFDSVPPMLRLDDNKVKAILDHFLIVVSDNREVFEFSRIVAPLFTLESSLNKEEVERYKRFLLFITLLSDHARDRKRFLAQFDMVKFTNMFDPITKQRLTNYVYR